ncbi:MAG: bifunctional metallophosphatase/5'-nucleotidase [Bacilli bacterium]
MRERLDIYHTNDIHSGWPQWLQIETLLAEARASGQEMLYVDCGDHLDRSNTITEALKGMWNIARLNAVQTDIVTVGNNEAITFSKDEMIAFYAQLQAPICIANFSDPSGNIEFVPFQVFEVCKGRKIGFIGVTAPFYKVYPLLGWHIEDPFVALKRYLPYLNHCDCIIVISHLGKSDDELIAETFPEVDVVLGAHTHHLFEKGKKVNQTLLCGCGVRGSHLGRLSIQWTPELEIVEETIKIEGIPVLTEVEESYKNAEYEAMLLLQQEEFTLQHSLIANPFTITPFHEAFVQAMRAYEGDFYLFHAGLTVETLSLGPVRTLDLQKALPHKLNFARMKISGKRLRTFVEVWHTHEIQQRMFTGYGFVGRQFGAFLIGNQRDLLYLFDGLAWIDDSADYTIVLPDFYAYSSFFKELHCEDYELLLNTMPKTLFRNMFPHKTKRLP